MKMPFSRKTKDAIKTALAMTIAYGIALSMNWDKPMWAGFAVAFTSLSTVQQSWNKSVLRMSGTLVAVGVALTIIAMFAQERWLFMIFLSAYVGLCTYMMGGKKYQYFWNVCGFVCVIVCMDAGPDPVNAFETAIERTQETGLGILVYTLISIFLWPCKSSEESLPESSYSKKKHLVFDLNRIVGVMQIVVTMWLSYIALIYVESVPGGAGFVSFTTVMGMVIATNPKISVAAISVPAIISILFSSMVYIFLMPQLSGFSQLGLLLFIVTFAVCYLFAGPKQILSRTFGLAVFVTIASISNQQTYSFISASNTGLMFILVLLLLVITRQLRVILEATSFFIGRDGVKKGFSKDMGIS